MVLEAFSVSHGKASAFLPVIDLLWSLVEKVTGKSKDELDLMLHDLQLAEFIYEQPATGDIE
jgi:hypothetical protein